MLLMPEVLRDALLRYLLTRPMAEVEEGVAALRALQPAPKAADQPPDGGGA